MNMQRTFIVFGFIGLFLISMADVQGQGERWNVARANEWYAKQGWLRGCNFQPSTAINQLEMFQAETFDAATIDKELGWAEELGFNVMRVYLHHLLWTADREGFKKRLDQYLSISSKHKIKTLFVFFDDCWNDTAWVGKQPNPIPGVHNSGWVRDPGTMLYRYPDTLNTLESYVKDIMGTFKNDQRILLWDLYNEPGNSGHGDKSFALLKSVFTWAREVNPSQPISVGIWTSNQQFNAYQLEHSDIITYHNYSALENHRVMVDSLKKYNRPLICTEYMARRTSSTFQTFMPFLKAEHIGAINWGFVSGKTNTIFAWDTPIKNGEEPKLWFHDIYRQDKTPFSLEEVKFIKTISARQEK
jgi:hypothetical protein